jgi:hypothetical protein
MTYNASLLTVATALTMGLVGTATTVSAQPVSTFSAARAIQAAQEVCPGTQVSNNVRVRRNAESTMISIINEGKSETVIHGGKPLCSPLQEMVMDIWRSPEGQAIGFVQLREEGRKLVIGETEFRGLRYDIDPTGTYFTLSQGQSSSIAAVSRPFRKLLSIDLDVQRVFARGRQVLVIGNNPVSGRLEYRTLQPSETGLSVVGQGAVGTQPAGVRVLDFDSRSGSVLISGTDASGQPGFVVVDISSGATRGIRPQSPGDDQALFVSNASLRRALTGTSAVAEGSTGGGSGFRLPFFRR